MIGIKRSGEMAEKSGPKRGKPADHPDSRQLRKRRDLLWLWLATRMGMDAVTISRVCQEAARSPRQIRSRIVQARQFYGRKGYDLPGV
jgi:hypothetical protein